MQEKNALQISNDMKCNFPFNFTKIGINQSHSSTKFVKVLLKNFDVLSKGMIKAEGAELFNFDQAKSENFAQAKANFCLDR